MNYSELSDFEINQRVMTVKGINPRLICPTPDYCNNPADAWPIMAQNNISLIYMGDYYWSATTDAKKYIKGGAAVSSIGVMPLRAVAIVYLMMQEQQHDR